MKRVWLAAAVLLLLRTASAGAAGNDPVIATDPTTGGVVTQSMVERMVQEDRRAAPLFGIAPPGPAAVGEITEALKSGFMTYDAGLRALITHSDRNLPYALPWLANATPESRQRFVDSMRPRIMSGSNDGYRYLSLAAILSGAGERGVRSGAGGGSVGATMGGLLASQNRRQNALMGAIRSGSSACNVYTGAVTQNLGYCHPY